MLAQMEAVVDQIGVGQGGARRSGEWRPHIECHDIDRLLLGGAQALLEEHRRGFSGAVLFDLQHRAVRAVAQDADVMMSGVEALLIHHQVGNRTLHIAPLQPARDRPLHQVAHLIRRQAQQLGGAALHLCGEQDIQREAFKEQREAPVRGRPRDPRRLHAAGATVHPRYSRREQGLKLTSIQMPPSARVLVIIDGRLSITGRTAKESRTGGMRQHDGDFGRDVIDLDRFDKPGSGNAENLLVKFS